MSATHLSAIDRAVAAVVLIVPVIIGIIYAIKDAKKATRSEYLLGGRQMSILPVATSLFITYIAGVALIGIPAEVYFFGYNYIYMVVGFSLSYVIGLYTVVPLTYPLQLTSLFEYLELRFKSKSVRIVCSITGLLAQMSYMTVNILSPALALQATAGIPLWMSIVVLGMTGTIYTTIGGIKGVIWTDAFQTIVVFVGVFTIIIKACSDIGGVGEMWRLASEGERLDFNNFSFDPRTRHTIWGLTIGHAAQRLFVSFNQPTIQRIICMKSLRDARVMFALNIPFTVVLNTLLATTGLAIYAYFKSISCDPFEVGLIDNRNQISAYFLLHTMEDMPGIAGLFISILCCSSLSTLSSGINSMAANTVEDILYKPLGSLKEATITLITKGIAMLFGCLVVVLSYSATSLKGPITQLTGIFLGALGSPITGVFLLGGSAPWTNKYGALSGFFCSLVFNVWVGMGSFLRGLKYPILPSAGTEGCNTTKHAALEVSFLNTTIASQGSIFSDEFSLYEVSYEWNAVIGLVLCLLIGGAISVITNIYVGKPEDEWKSTKSKYVFPFMRKLWEVEQATQSHQTKREFPFMVTNSSMSLTAGL